MIMCIDNMKKLNEVETGIFFRFTNALFRGCLGIISQVENEKVVVILENYTATTIISIKELIKTHHSGEIYVEVIKNLDTLKALASWHFID